MPKVGDQPEQLRPYLFHGLDLSWAGSSEATGDCPFCGGSRKLYVSQKSGLFDCKTCDAQGNNYTFLRQLHEASVKITTIADLELISAERKISPAMLQKWGLVQSVIDREALLPAYGFKNGINNLYRWTRIGGKRKLSTTATMSHCLFGLQFWDDNKPDVYICEGPWDAMALEEAFIRYRRDSSGKLIRTANVLQSLYAGANIVAVPGCETFKEDWAKFFASKNIILLYDSDHPRKYKEGHPKAGEFILHKDGSKTIPGWDGMRSAASKLLPVANSVSVLDWGPEGYDERLRDGFDVRDYLTTKEVIEGNATTTSALAQ